MNVKEPGLRPGAAAPPDCEHNVIVTFRGELHGLPADGSMWACSECRRRFYPVCPTCVDVGHRNVVHPDSSQPTPTEGGPQ